MITRVRIEAEGSTPDEVMRQLDTAHAALKIETLPPEMADLMFGYPNLSGAREGLSDAQTGECVIERFGRDASDDPDRAGHGGIVYKGRMTAHYAKPQKLMKLTGHSTWPGSGPVSEAPVPDRDPEYSSTQGSAGFEVTSTQGREGEPVERVPALNVATDAPLTRERLVATWNENVPPVQRPHAQPLRLYVVPGDLFVRACQLWQTDGQLQALYERPIEHANLSPKHWLVSPQAGVGG